MDLWRDGGRQTKTPELLCLRSCPCNDASLSSFDPARLFVSMDVGNTVPWLRYHDSTHGALQVRFSRSGAGQRRGSAHRTSVGLSDSGSPVCALFFVAQSGSFD